MKVLITGATGFLGSSLAKSLVNAGADVYVLARPQSKPHRLVNLPITRIEADITRVDTLRGTFDGADYVIHAAGKLGGANVPDAVYQEIHVEGTRHVLDEASRVIPVPRVLYVSSPGVLGPVHDGLATEETPLAPSNAYERSKAAAEQLVKDYFAAGVPVVIGRPEFIYGPGDTHVLGLFQAIKKGRFFYIGDGRNHCHPTFIEDAVDGLLLCMENGRPGEIYHILGPRPVTFRELATTIAGTLGVPPPRLQLPKLPVLVGAIGLETVARITNSQPPLSRSGVAFFNENRSFSWEKAFKELQYQPKFDLKSGVAATVDWYKQENYL